MTTLTLNTVTLGHVVLRMHFEELDRDIHPTCQDSKPFGPLLLQPETIRLDKADHRVEQRG